MDRKDVALMFVAPIPHVKCEVCGCSVAEHNTRRVMGMTVCPLCAMFLKLLEHRRNFLLVSRGVVGSGMAFSCRCGDDERCRSS